MIAPSFTMRPAKASTNIHSHAYDVASKTLRIKFLSGSTYDYHGVDPVTASAFETSKSMGTYVALHVKGKHKTSLVEAKPERKGAAA